MIPELRNLILNKKTSEMNKITLKKLFYLINFVLEDNQKISNNKKDIEDTIDKSLNSPLFKIKLEDIEKDVMRKSIVDIRIKSIMQTEGYQEYIDKLIRDGYLIYIYKDKKVIYIRNSNLRKEEIGYELKEYDQLLLIGKDKRKKIKLKDFHKDNLILSDYDKIILKSPTL